MNFSFVLQHLASRSPTRLRGKVDHSINTHLNNIYIRQLSVGQAEHLINTPGCTIPNYMKHYKFKEPANKKAKCYERMVHVEKTSDGEITFRIRNYTNKRERWKCGYQFVRRSNVRGKEDHEVILPELKPFEDGHKVIQEEEVIAVSCDVFSPKNKKISTYSDAYLIIKKKPTDLLKIPIRDNVVLVKENWNVVIVGMDTMSRARAYHSLPKTVRYLQNNGWLDYRGYQKVAENTFPNIMTLLSGKNASSAIHDCSHGMDGCESSLIWNKFREAGYITAFGEDNLGLPDTFGRHKGFTLPPTDHYARPLFLMGEYTSGNLVCAKNKPSAEHLLDYISQFVKAYSEDSFFGYFWINSYSHNLNNLPTLLEANLIDFFEHFRLTNASYNTFVFFLSDHGVRFGPQRIPRESYYEERLPMLFMWVPHDYRELYPKEYYNLQLNQHRFTTPYDVHATLVDILKKTANHIEVSPPQGCPQCNSLTKEVSPDRTCEAANVDQKWCSCHGLHNASADDDAATRSLNLAVKYIIKDRAKSIKTKNCTYCSPLGLKQVLRNDWYQIGDKTYYVVAFQLKPGDVAFEATVEKFGDQFTILHPTTTISQYNVRGASLRHTNEKLQPS
ncbi:hypothetical protein NE865_08210 [Phthorimaea operculella]|nr:hypothetical protein NE865_08210 [Phthorimaea operculella]